MILGISDVTLGKFQIKNKTKYKIIYFICIIICILFLFIIDTKKLPRIKNLHINHYITKSREEYLNRKKEDCALGITSIDKLKTQFKIINKNINEIKDTRSRFYS